MQEEVGEPHEGLGAHGEVRIEGGEELGHGGDEREAHDDNDDDGEHDDDGGIDEAGLELLDDLVGLFGGDADAAAHAAELSGLLAGDDEGEDFVGETVRVLGHGLAELLAHREAGDELGNEALVFGGLDAVGLELKAFDNADVTVKTAAEAGEEGGCVIRAGTRGAEALDLFVHAGDVLDDGGLVGCKSAADERLLVRVGVDELQGGGACVDVGDFDFFEHGGGRLKGVTSRWGDKR